MKKFLKNLYWIPAIVLVLFAVWLNFSMPVTILPANAHQGVLSLSGWDGGSILKLGGEWQYYDGLMIRDIQKQSSPQYVLVPHLFESKQENKRKSVRNSYIPAACGRIKNKYSLRYASY